LYDSAHPAVIQLLAQVIQAALAANVEVGICGEMGGDTRYSRLLFGMGLRRYSMHPSRLLAVKSCLRQFNAALHAPLIATLLQEHDRAAIEAGLSLLNA
jgi:phosphotransferase system enzyme I (PtsI)